MPKKVSGSMTNRMLNLPHGLSLATCASHDRDPCDQSPYFCSRTISALRLRPSRRAASDWLPAVSVSARFARRRGRRLEPHPRTPPPPPEAASPHHGPPARPPLPPT